ncbi:MAG: RluA family pseudouridine synthase [Sphingomonadales bacterium]
MSRVQVKTVTPDESGIRLDRWFKANFPELPFGRLSKLLRTGQVRVNGKRAKGNDRVGTGDEIRIPPLEAAKAKPKGPRPLNPEERQEIREMVLFQDSDVIALNKPPGLAVQGGSGTTKHVDRLLPALQGRKDERPPRLVHRLDKDTSGVLVVARNAPAARALTGAFKDKTCRKVYWALVKGVPKPLEGKISAPVSKSLGGQKEIMVVSKTGKPAVTLFKVMDFAGDEVSWLALSPVTGRTHQIRVHLAHIGHPILGDGKYGGEDSRFGDLSQKLHLHSAALSFPHPGGGTREITAALPPHMMESFKYLGFFPNEVKDPFEGFPW